MESCLSQLESMINQIVTRDGFTGFKFQDTENTKKGHNYLGEVIFTGVVATKNNTNKNYSLVIKMAQKSDELRKQSPLKEAYEMEIFLYTRVFSLFNEFQSEYGIEKPFNNIPKCYSSNSADKNEMIILENVSGKGFQLHDSKSSMNLSHVRLVFESYAKFHAVSLAMKQKRPGLFENLTGHMTDIMGKFMVMGFLASFVNHYRTGLEYLEEDGEFDAAEKLRKIENDIEEILKSCMDKESEFSVILHGDCWNNNLMFKYDDSDRDKPVDICFLDFQLSRASSPAVDLSHFLYTCADKKILDNFDFLLGAYYTSLSSRLREFGCTVPDCVSIKSLKAQWKTYGKFGLGMAPLMLKLCICDANEKPDLVDAAEGSGFTDALSFKIGNEAEYKRRIKDIMLHFSNYFLE